ncbi:9672_t:CDS:2 [Paraglomus brasilianum]|uniref:9672_t:CDS:1 n=1 Tax=Paraglomus brasilianum TaxID=144538 RepID=A0A9N9D8J4_9GLOM|nr:9672_t:CDS:2 [Paraglomus brasilianum]
MEPGKIYQDPNLHLNDQEWLQMDEVTDRLSALTGPSTLQSLMDTISKGVMDRIMPFLPNKKNNTSNDGMDEITKGMSELSINKAIAKGVSKGISQGMKEKKGSKSRISNSSKPRKSKQTSPEEIREIVMDILKELLPLYLLQSLKPNFNPIRPAFTEKLPSIQDRPEESLQSNNNYREPIPEIPDSDEEDETLDDPMEIDFVRRKEPVISIATIPVKIKRLKIPALVLDSGAEPAIVSEDIVKRVGGEIDKSEKYDLSGVATVSTESVGITRNLPITFSPGFTIHEDFVVVQVPKPTLIFPNPLLKKYKCAVDWGGNDKMKIHYNGEDFIIPVTMYKVKNKLEEADSNESDNDPLEEWHAPAGFSLDSDNSTLKKKRMSYEALEKSLYTTLQSKAEINGLCEKLQMRYEKLLECISSRDDSVNKEKID